MDALDEIERCDGCGHETDDHDRRGDDACNLCDCKPWRNVGRPARNPDEPTPAWDR